MAITSDQLPLKQLAEEGGAGVDAGDVADERLSETRGEAGDVVTRLVCVREDDVRRLELPNQLLKGQRIAVRGVFLEKRMLHCVCRGGRLTRNFNKFV